jgi:hypothetical protein
VYEDSQKALKKVIPYTMLADFLAGGFAGFCSVMANNPIDVVKTNMQGLDAERYGNFANCFSTILREEGFGGLYKGVVPRLARVILDVALTFTIFGSLKRTIAKMIAARQSKDK